MVFSMNTVKEITAKELITESSYKDIKFEDQNFFLQSLDMCLEESKIFAASIASVNVVTEGLFSSRNIADDIYTTAKHAISDAMKHIDWTHILSGIYDWFMQSIANLGKAFLSSLLSFINKDATVAKNKYKLAHFAGPIKYNKPMYNFQNLGINNKLNTSYTEYSADMGDVVDSLLEDLEDVRECTTKEDISRILDDLNDDRESNAEYVGYVRGKLVGEYNTIIEASDFADRLFVYFHGSDTVTIPNLGFFDKPNINRDRILEAYKGYFDYNVQKAEVDNFIHKCQSECRTDKMKLRKIQAKEYLDNDLLRTAEAMAAFNSVVNSRARLIQDVCNVYLQFFSAKLDAMKEYTILNRNILFECIKQMERASF